MDRERACCHPLRVMLVVNAAHCELEDRTEERAVDSLLVVLDPFYEANPKKIDLVV